MGRSLTSTFSGFATLEEIVQNYLLGGSEGNEAELVVLPGALVSPTPEQIQASETDNVPVLFTKPPRTHTSFPGDACRTPERTDGAFIDIKQVDC